MDLGEIIRTLGPTVIALGPHVRRAALYMFHNRARGAEYDRHFRELLAYARQDVRAMDDNLRDVLLLCEEFGIDPNQEGSLTRINVRLDWYLSIRQRRVLKKINHLADEFGSSVSGIVDVIACLTGLTAVPEVTIDVEAPGYYETQSVTHLASMERDFQGLMADSSLSIGRFIDYALGFLNECDAVLQEFTQGIDVGLRPVR